MDSEHEITDWSVTRWNCMEHDMYFDPSSLRMQEEVDIYRQESPGDWVPIKRIWVHGRKLSEYNKYLLDLSIMDYRRSLSEHRAHMRLKRRRKIKRRQKRAAFRRWKRGLA